MQKELGRSPDDFSEEFAAWADQMATDALCDCVISLYGPLDQILSVAEDMYEDVIDGLMSANKNKPTDDRTTSYGSN